MDSRVRTITNKKSISEYIAEIWNYNELFWILAKRDIIVKYKQAILGVGWAAIRPLITTLVMALAFGRLGKLDVNSPIPYMLIVSAGVTIWLFFSQCLTTISTSLVLNSNLITKVYFPRLIIPISSIFIGLVDVVVSLAVFAGICLYYQYLPDWKLILVPAILALTFLASFGIGLIAAVLNVKYRDIGQLISFVVQFGTFLSPVAYLTDAYKTGTNGDILYKLAMLNPVTGCIDAMRWAMLGDFAAFNWNSFIPLVVFILITFFYSIRFFRKHEDSFVDYI
ncbi:ABC transporter permease [Leadbetterella byssophila]|uniref:ABC transporter permease n=1 Tax=Leadbetterella byssophila TaxID=316068 RepID=UPI0039A05406